MKQKQLPFKNAAFFKWHLLLFVTFTVGLWLSVLATFEYPGNATVPFEAFKPFLVERMTFNIVWGLLLLIHFGVYQLQSIRQMRAYRTHLDSIKTMDIQIGQRLITNEEASQKRLAIPNDEAVLDVETSEIETVQYQSR